MKAFLLQGQGIYGLGLPTTQGNLPPIHHTTTESLHCTTFVETSPHPPYTHKNTMVTTVFPREGSSVLIFRFPLHRPSLLYEFPYVGSKNLGKLPEEHKMIGLTPNRLVGAVFEITPLRVKLIRRSESEKTLTGSCRI